MRVITASIQHAATHYNTLQYTATQHIAPHRTHCFWRHILYRRSIPASTQHTAAHRTTLLYSGVQHTASHCIALQHTATRCMNFVRAKLYIQIYTCKYVVYDTVFSFVVCVCVCLCVCVCVREHVWMHTYVCVPIDVMYRSAVFMCIFLSFVFVCTYVRLYVCKDVVWCAPFCLRVYAWTCMNAHACMWTCRCDIQICVVCLYL